MILVDYFGGAGGAAAGYARAGFTVIGVDHEPQSHYPFRFRQADAIRNLRSLLHGGTVDEHGEIGLDEIDAFHASPPCQRWSPSTVISGDPGAHPDLIELTRDLFEETGKPYVIENVPRAGGELRNPVTLCGAAYCPTIEEDGVRYYLKRHRLFETSFPVLVAPCACSRARGTILGIYGGGTRQASRRDGGGGNTAKANLAQARSLMGIEWMNRKELTQAIPPAYTEHLGGYLAEHLDRAKVA